MLRNNNYYQNSNYSQQNQKNRKSKDGDWLCFKCSNYNYAFRDLCNRCHLQYKIENDRMMEAMGKQNYGENSFPSVLFLTLGSKQSRDQNFNKENSENMYQKKQPRKSQLFIQKSQKKEKYLQKQTSEKQIQAIQFGTVWIDNLLQ